VFLQSGIQIRPGHGRERAWRESEPETDLDTGNNVVGTAGAAYAGSGIAGGPVMWPEAVEPLTLSEADQLAPIPIDRAPLTVQELTPLTKLHFLFATCLFAQLFVVRGDRVLGAVLKEDMADTERLEQGRVFAIRGRH